jgi:4'-phosphopantetheinyl transferase
MACAVKRLGEVGVDVENNSQDRGIVEVADHYFSSIELAGLEALGAVDQQSQFFRIWTLKEAYIKARGEGHSQPLDSFSFYCPQPSTIRLVAQGDEVDGWSFWSLQPVAGQMIAVAVQSVGANLRVFSRNSQGIQQELPLTSLGEVA